MNHKERGIESNQELAASNSKAIAEQQQHDERQTTMGREQSVSYEKENDMKRVSVFRSSENGMCVMFVKARAQTIYVSTKCQWKSHQ